VYELMHVCVSVCTRTPSLFKSPPIPILHIHAHVQNTYSPTHTHTHTHTYKNTRIHYTQVQRSVANVLAYAHERDYITEGDKVHLEVVEDEIVIADVQAGHVRPKESTSLWNKIRGKQ
jgi:hypothetical protein